MLRKSILLCRSILCEGGTELSAACVRVRVRACQPAFQCRLQSCLCCSNRHKPNRPSSPTQFASNVSPPPLCLSLYHQPHFLSNLSLFLFPLCLFFFPLRHLSRSIRHLSIQQVFILPFISELASKVEPHIIEHDRAGIVCSSFG